MTQNPTPPPANAVRIQPGVLFNVFSVLGVFTLLAVMWLIHAVFPEAWKHYQLVTEEHFKVEAFRNFMLAVGAVGAIIVGAWGFALAAVRTHALSRQARTAEKEAALNEKKHAVETELTQRKHASDAFATAISQLGHENYAVQLGAVYALEALAKSSRELHGPIFETLCAYVRKETPAPAENDGVAPALSLNYGVGEVNRPDVVIQAILTVTGRRDPKRDPQGFRLDLRKTNLHHADLSGGHFERALFTKARLEGANLIETHLENADLIEANLEYAFLTGANLDGAFLNGANLEGAHLLKARLEGANLWSACLKNAHLREAHLEATNLSDARLEGANLTDAHLERAEMWNTHLERANLKRAQFTNASLKDITFDAKTIVFQSDFSGARDIPAHPGFDFRATVKGADAATWPADGDPGAWDREEKETPPF